MTTPTKTKPKKTKATQPLPHEKASEYIGLGQLLQDHENSFITIEEAINDHAVKIDELNEFISIHNDSLAKLKHEEIAELRHSIDHSINCIFWMTAIGIAVAITFSGVAIFR
jgi:septal ring factor EnvC (AmiA/AmiB activator)